MDANSRLGAVVKLNSVLRRAIAIDNRLSGVYLDLGLAYSVSENTARRPTA
jgi:hypothetical protein